MKNGRQKRDLPVRRIFDIIVMELSGITLIHNANLLTKRKFTS